MDYKMTAVFDSNDVLWAAIYDKAKPANEGATATEICEEYFQKYAVPKMREELVKEDRKAAYRALYKHYSGKRGADAENLTYPEGWE